MNNERITAYLLNELSKREAEQFEEQCFAEPEWPEGELESAEEDLIQAYIKKELGFWRRRRFKKYYLITQARKDRVLIARSFLRLACTTDPPKVNWRQKLGTFLNPKALGPWATVSQFAAVILVIGLSVTLALLVFRTKVPQTFAQLNLVIRSDNRAVSSDVQTVRLPINEDAVRISLKLPEPAPAGSTYRVQWEDVKGPLEDLNIEKQDANLITVVIPAEKLKHGQYVLKLFRKNPDGTEQRVPGNYLFNVE